MNIGACGILTAPTFEFIFKGMVYDPKNKTIYNNSCDFKPIGYVKNGKIYYRK